MLQQVSHTDGWMKLSGLVWHIYWVSLLVGVWLDQAACVTGHRVGFIYEKKTRLFPLIKSIKYIDFYKDDFDITNFNITNYLSGLCQKKGKYI